MAATTLEFFCEFFFQRPRFDYTNQAWIVNGVYVRCGHPDSMDCQCFGKLHAGEPAREGAEIA